MRLRHLVTKEFRQLRRDPRLLRMVIMAPVIQLVIFGYAVTFDVQHVPAVLLDGDMTRESRELASRFENSRCFDIEYVVSRPADMTRLIDSGRAQVGIEIPEGFARDLARQESAPLQIVVDGTDSVTAGKVLGYSSGVVKRFGQEILAERAARRGVAGSSRSGIQESTRVWYNPDLKSVNYMVPGVLCMILLVITMILTSLAVVKEREIGTLEQLVVTPIRPMELMLGKVIPFAAIGFVDVLLILVVARYWFLVPVAGSVVLLLALTGVFLVTSLGLGIFVSTVSMTQQQAMMTSFFIMLPTILLSGFMFPIENMPRAVQLLTYFLPLRYILAIIRGVFLKGSGLDVLWPESLALAAFGAAIITLSALRFTKRLG